MRKLTKKELKRKAESTKGIVRGIINESVHLPDDAMIFDLDTLLEIFTKKRLELIQYINSCNPQSIQELADMTGRKKQAVFRDLKILERDELVKLIKKGKQAIPKVQRKLAVLNLQEIFAFDVPKKALCSRDQKSKDIVNAEVYVDNKNINKLIKV